jgi:phosphoglycerate dehydrogenase-like enzyme
MYTPDPPSDDHLRRLRDLDPSLTVNAAFSEAEALQWAPTTEVILGHRYLRQVLPHAPLLRWVQSTSGATDALPEATLAARNILLSRFTGGSRLVAQHAFAMAWALTRALPTLVQQQATGTWAKGLPLLPAPERALVLGTGEIGRALADLLGSHEVQVTGVKQHVDGPVPPFDTVLDTINWRSALPNTDWCFLALPNTDSTANMMDEAALRALPAHALVVNVGRGETLDWPALIRVLESGHLGGVALDVVPHALNPLPANHPLWTTPRLLLSPHVAGHAPARPALVEQFIESQVARYLAGRPLANVVLPQASSRSSLPLSPAP